jgi:hypothetical protein
MIRRSRAQLAIGGQESAGTQEKNFEVAFSSPSGVQALPRFPAERLHAVRTAHQTTLCLRQLRILSRSTGPDGYRRGINGGLTGRPCFFFLPSISRCHGGMFAAGFRQLRLFKFGIIPNTQSAIGQKPFGQPRRSDRGHEGSFGCDGRGQCPRGNY